MFEKIVQTVGENIRSQGVSIAQWDRIDGEINNLDLDVNARGVWNIELKRRLYLLFR